jgi:hypothetical protein
MSRRCSTASVHLLVARHVEPVDWALALASPDVCVWICSAGRPLGVDGEIVVRNTGREAMCYVEFLHRLVHGTLNHHLVPHATFMFAQGDPHCASLLAEHGIPCSLQVGSEVQLARADDVDGRGGFSWLVPDDYSNSGNGFDKSCVDWELSRLTGLEVNTSARGMRQLWSESLSRLPYVSGAQFMLTAATLRRMPQPVMQLVWRARAVFLSAEMELSSAPSAQSRRGSAGSEEGGRAGEGRVGGVGPVAPRNDFDHCCPGAYGGRRTCLPWLLERLWMPIFLHLADAVRIASEDDRRALDGSEGGAEGASAWCRVVRQYRMIHSHKSNSSALPRWGPSCQAAQLTQLMRARLSTAQLAERQRKEARHCWRAVIARTARR